MALADWLEKLIKKDKPGINFPRIEGVVESSNQSLSLTGADLPTGIKSGKYSVRVFQLGSRTPFPVDVEKSTTGGLLIKERQPGGIQSVDLPQWVKDLHYTKGGLFTAVLVSQVTPEGNNPQFLAVSNLARFYRPRRETPAGLMESAEEEVIPDNKGQRALDELVRGIKQYTTDSVQLPQVILSPVT